MIVILGKVGSEFDAFVYREQHGADATPGFRIQAISDPAIAGAIGSSQFLRRPFLSVANPDFPEIAKFAGYLVRPGSVDKGQITNLEDLLAHLDVSKVNSQNPAVVVPGIVNKMKGFANAVLLVSKFRSRSDDGFVKDVSQTGIPKEIKQIFDANIKAVAFEVISQWGGEPPLSIGSLLPEAQGLLESRLFGFFSLDDPSRDAKVSQMVAESRNALSITLQRMVADSELMSAISNGEQRDYYLFDRFTGLSDRQTFSTMVLPPANSQLSSVRFILITNDQDFKIDDQRKSFLFDALSAREARRGTGRPFDKAMLAVVGSQ